MPMIGGPREYPRRVLLAAAGLTPQVVTETFYALAMKDPPWFPTEVRLITTVEGAERARLMLLGSGQDWFHRLLDEYDFPRAVFDEEMITVLEGSDGRGLTDIQSVEDNRHTADSIVELIRTLTADPESTLHVSLAGGRTS